ncbi:glycosyltransferase family 4 protein [Hahella aquimaris]|uniref:glycosyltransferase family 4 protein n=1 Tax=Hahella sp. HNIBRBA332 TaxID=3015983 RepID=UPI00273B456A|nr:glycosyltransferase family 4 protein [Hahella sp. HNIBRBA332]WLQ13840.1 glycosyltransferase family 4 protein [Hahella sp. HNIBRBA332]
MKPEKRKFKIAMVAACPFPANHGSPASIREMSEALVSLGNEVHIVTYPIKEDIPVVGPHIHRVRVPGFKKNAIRVGPSPEKFLFNPLMVFKLIRVILKYDIDIIHAHNYEGVLIGWLAKLITRRPLLYNAVNSMTDELPTYDFFKNKDFARKLAAFLDKTLPFKGDHVTAVSDDLKHFLVELGVDADKITVLPAGVVPEMFDNPNPERIYARHQLSKDDHYLVYTGSLDAFQRIDYLLETMARVAARRNDVKLLLVGNISNPEAHRKYQRMAEELGIAHQVLFCDQVPLDELPDYLAVADVAVIPRPECPGHPVKVLNYMSAGVAIAGFRGGAKGLTHESNALIVDNHDCDALADAAIQLLDDDAKRQRLGQAARQVVDKFYTWRQLAQGIEVLYEHLYTGGERAPREKLREFILETYSPNDARS